MFDTLIESKRKPEKKKVLGVGSVSLVIHTAIIAAAVYATANAGKSETAVTVDTTMVFLQEQQQKPPEQQVVQLDVQLKGFQTIIAPTEIPADIPPINLQEHFDPRDYTGTGVEGGIGTGIVPEGQVYAEAIVEEKPERLSGPDPVFPELLKQARIQGQVLVEVVIDTTGRAELTTFKIVKSPNPGFDQAVRASVQRTLFRPARVHGRAVRVLVRIPYNFVLRN